MYKTNEPMSIPFDSEQSPKIPLLDVRQNNGLTP
jgi:hypothetical protein